MVRKNREEFKTREGVFDRFTLRTLFKLESKGHFTEVESPVSIGKEANVFTAKAKVKKVIVKIYRLQNADFNAMYSYIRTDPRFIGLRSQRRKVIFAWTKREYANLLKAREAGVSAPLPIAFLNNVLVEEYIGDDNPAPQLKSQKPKDTKKFFDLIITNMKKLHNAGLVHGDLSQFNILNHKETPVLIDFSQATTKEDPEFMTLLKRDVKNVCSFFTKQGLEISKEETLKEITGK